MSDETQTLEAQDEAFTAAFDQFTEPGEAPAPEAAAPAAPPAPEPETEPASDEEQAPPADAAAATGDDSDGAALEPEAETPEPEESDEDMMRRLAALLRKTRPEAPPAPPAPPSSRAPEPAPEAPPALYTEEEQQLIAKYEEDWPEVARAEALRRRGEYQQIVDYVFSEVAKTFAPMMQSTESMAAMQHLNQLQQLVPDYDEVRDSVIEWAQSQPTYLKSAYDRVIQQGTPDEVADLIARYRAETGGRSTPAAPPAPARTTELSSQAKKAASALAPVSSKRSAVSSALDPSDFDNAFATFASKL